MVCMSGSVVCMSISGLTLTVVVWIACFVRELFVLIIILCQSLLVRTSTVGCSLSMARKVLKKHILKRPSAPAGWQAFADAEKEGEDAEKEGEEAEAEPDTSAITPQQRHVWKKTFDSLPAEVRENFQATRGSGKVGACKEANAIINAIIPKDAGYGHTVVLDSTTLERY